MENEIVTLFGIMMSPELQNNIPKEDLQEYITLEEEKNDRYIFRIF